jgi:competence ComEA-like helix-hairpin-helix protein
VAEPVAEVAPEAAESDVPAVEAVASAPVEEPAVEPAPEPVDLEPVAAAESTPAEAPAPVEEDVPVYDLEVEPSPAPAPALESPVEESSPVERVSEPVPMAELPIVADVPAVPAVESEELVAEASTPDEGGAEDEAVSATRLLLSGLDLNSATAEEMHARLDGVGLKLAQRIVACRETGGPFTDLFDLARVSGLRARRFEQVTGLPWNAAYFRHRDQVNQLLGVPAGAMPDVRQVAARFSELTDFSGCMLIHEDGLVLAQSWNHPSAEALGAFAPQMFKKIHRYVKPLKLGEMNSLCFFVGHQPITVVRSGTIYFAALHKPDKLTKKQVSLAQALAMELGRRFARS